MTEEDRLQYRLAHEVLREWISNIPIFEPHMQGFYYAAHQDPAYYTTWKLEMSTWFREKWGWHLNWEDRGAIENELVAHARDLAHEYRMLDKTPTQFED